MLENVKNSIIISEGKKRAAREEKNGETSGPNLACQLAFPCTPARLLAHTSSRALARQLARPPTPARVPSHASLPAVICLLACPRTPARAQAYTKA